jgi:TRAP-type C4-dicarboxylate transport system permease small subunit
MSETPDGGAPLQDARDRGTGAIGAIARALALVGGLALLATAAMVTISVLLRWSGRQPIPGDFEIVQMAMALVVFAFLPICQIRRGNIAVEMFTDRLPRPINAWLDATWDIVYAATAALLAYALALGTADVLANHTQTMVLTLPLWPALSVTSVLAAFLAVVAVTSAILLVRGRR